MKHLPGILVAIAVLGLTGAMDASDAKHAAEVYCAKVADQEWPDYQGTYKDCKKN